MSHILQGHLAEELDYGPINDGESSDRGLRLIALYPLPTLDHSLLIVQNKEGRVITIEVDNEYR